MGLNSYETLTGGSLLNESDSESGSSRRLPGVQQASEVGRTSAGCFGFYDKNVFLPAVS